MPTQPPSARPYSLPIRPDVALPNDDAQGVTEEMIRSVVVGFYRRARRDAKLGPIFDAHVAEWPEHLGRMTDFWSAALRRTGRYTGNPVESHRRVPTLAPGHFDRRITLFEQTVRDLCPPREAEAFLARALRMREGLTKGLAPDPRIIAPRPRRPGRAAPSWGRVEGPISRASHAPGTIGPRSRPATAILGIAPLLLEPSTRPDRRDHRAVRGAWASRR